MVLWRVWVRLTPFLFDSGKFTLQLQWVLARVFTSIHGSIPQGQREAKAGALLRTWYFKNRSKPKSPYDREALPGQNKEEIYNELFTVVSSKSGFQKFWFYENQTQTSGFVETRSRESGFLIKQQWTRSESVGCERCDSTATPIADFEPNYHFSNFKNTRFFYFRKSKNILD